MRDDILILFPGALGDFLCLWPTLQRLRTVVRGRVVVGARPALGALLGPAGCELVSIDRREVADLFGHAPLGPATRALFRGFAYALSWTGFDEPAFGRRLADCTGGRVVTHPFRGMRRGEHAVTYYARCAGVTPLFAPLRVSADARRWAADLRRPVDGHVPLLCLHPGSGSPTKNWEGMVEIARWWRQSEGGRVLTLNGPAEAQSPLEVPSDVVVRDAPLDRVAALLSTPLFYLGNDSGISHLAGLAGAHGLALFAASDPATWRPLGGGIRVLHAPNPCARCGPARFCVHRLPVDVVQTHLGEHTRRDARPRRRADPNAVAPIQTPPEWEVCTHDAVSVRPPDPAGRGRKP